MKTIEIDQLANCVLTYFSQNDLKISPLKLQKMIYFIQAWHIAYFNKESLIVDTPQAWVNGPVYKRLYDKYKNDYYSKDNIVTTIRVNINNLDLEFKQKELISAVLDRYSILDESKLVLLTHSDAPWNEAREGLQAFEPSSNPITIEMMYKFYSSKIK